LVKIKIKRKLKLDGGKRLKQLIMARFTEIITLCINRLGVVK